MKRLSNSDSLGGLISICPNSTVVDVDEYNQGNNPLYTREFQTMLDCLDVEGYVEESGQLSEKKRRLSFDQVKALERNFEVESKLEPEKKEKLAQEIGLQPRQVAVWFQNRRARSKTKQLERDYGLLKANHDALKRKYESFQKENGSLLNEIRELKSKLNTDGKSDSKVSIKEEPSVYMTEENRKLEKNANSVAKCDEDATEFNFENCNGSENEIIEGVTIFRYFKDGSSDSDSSAILNEDNNSPMAAISSYGGIIDHSPHRFLDIHSGSNSSMNINFQFSDTKISILGDANKAYQPQFVKIEEHNIFGEESCSNLFSDDQAPTLSWYCSDGWN